MADSGGHRKVKKLKLEEDDQAEDDDGIGAGGIEGEPVSRKPGQKHPTPTPGFADRVFYETLLQQRPDSVMAQDWCVAYGVLHEAMAESLYRKVCKRKGTEPNRSPVKRQTPTKPSRDDRDRKKGGGSRGKVLRDGPADTGLDAGSAFEGVGTIGA